MTFPAKESFIYFERLDQRQRRIYPDACDYGIPYAEVDLAEARKHARALMAVFAKPEYEYEAHTWDAGYATGGKYVQFFIPIEYDGGLLWGYHVRLMGCRDRRVPGYGFLSIDITRESRDR